MVWYCTFNSMKVTDWTFNSKHIFIGPVIIPYSAFSKQIFIVWPLVIFRNCRPACVCWVPSFWMLHVSYVHTALLTTMSSVLEKRKPSGKDTTASFGASCHLDICICLTSSYLKMKCTPSFLIMKCTVSVNDTDKHISSCNCLWRSSPCWLLPLMTDYILAGSSF